MASWSLSVEKVLAGFRGFTWQVLDSGIELRKAWNCRNTAFDPRKRENVYRLEAGLLRCQLRLVLGGRSTYGGFSNSDAGVITAGQCFRPSETGKYYNKKCRSRCSRRREGRIFASPPKLEGVRLRETQYLYSGGTFPCLRSNTFGLEAMTSI